MRRDLLLPVLGLCAGVAIAAAGRSGAFVPASAISLAGSPVIGTRTLPDGDAPDGGHGKPVGEIRCDPMEGARYHVHAHLSIFADGRQITVPKHVGVVAVSDDADPDECYYWVHTHDESGIVHVESPGRTAFTLGDLFRIWGRPLTAERVADFAGPVTAFVDGRRYAGDPAEIPIRSHAQITLVVGKLVDPPAYVFSTHD